MSDRARHDAPGTGVPGTGVLAEELFDDAFLDDVFSRNLPTRDAAEPSRASESGQVRPLPHQPEVPLSGAAAHPGSRAGGVDVLAEPAARSAAAGPACGTGTGVRERIRASRFGSALVLLVTAVLVAGGVWAVKTSQSTGTGAAGGTAAVTLPGTSTVPPPTVGAPAQDFTLTTIDGTTVSLGQFQGQPVWIVFGASWCAGCQAEISDIVAAQKQYGAQGLVILGVNISESQSAVRDYAERVGITFPIGADTESSIADAYRVSAIPAHFFVGEDGVLREIRQGAVSPETIATAVKGVLAP